MGTYIQQNITVVKVNVESPNQVDSEDVIDQKLSNKAIDFISPTINNEDLNHDIDKFKDNDIYESDSEDIYISDDEDFKLSDPTGGSSIMPDRTVVKVDNDENKIKNSTTNNEAIDEPHKSSNKSEETLTPKVDCQKCKVQITHLCKLDTHIKSSHIIKYKFIQTYGISFKSLRNINLKLSKSPKINPSKFSRKKKSKIKINKPKHKGGIIKFFKWLQNHKIPTKMSKTVIGKPIKKHTNLLFKLLNIKKISPSQLISTKNKILIAKVIAGSQFLRKKMNK